MHLNSFVIFLIRKQKPEKKNKKGDRNRGLTSVLQTSSNTLHGENESVFQTRSILTCWVKCYEFISRFTYLYRLFGDVRTQLHVVVWITNAFQCVCLAHIQGGDVRITQPKSLLQVWISFKKISMASHLKIHKMEHQLVE